MNLQMRGLNRSGHPCPSFVFFFTTLFCLSFCLQRKGGEWPLSVLDKSNGKGAQPQPERAQMTSTSIDQPLQVGPGIIIT